MITLGPRPSAARQAAEQSLFLVVVPGLDAIDRLPAAAGQARRAGARLLVGLARPRPGFTTDAAIAARAAARDHAACLALLIAAHTVLDECDVDYELVLVSHRDSRDAAKRTRRIVAAMSRLARAKGATLLYDGMSLPKPVITTVPGRPTARYRRAHVVAVLPDSSEAVKVARVAGEMARYSGRALALVVPLPGLLSPRDRGEMARGYGRIGEDMAAIAGRVRPALDGIGVPSRVYCAPYRADGPAAELPQLIATAIEEVAHLLHAQDIVLSATSPAAALLRTPAGLYVVPATHPESLAAPATVIT